MLDINNKSMCCGCSACKNICPKDAIIMVEDEKGFKYPTIKKNRCINCNLCEKSCPIINNKNNSGIPVAYAAINTSEEIRMQSSSGGVFTLIAENIIAKNGAVFGVCFDENFFTVHEKAETIEELAKFRGSKYVQSDLKDTFREVKKVLENDRYVLFTGTPCQIEGLKTFLGKEYSKLYTQDLICHGVPSKKVWEKYLEYRKSINKENIKEISFRNKDNKGWNKYQLLFTYRCKKEFIDHQDDIFMKIFLSDIALRDSCYNCRFKKKIRNSDITLADFWGIEEVLPEMNDEKGTSLVIVHSEKGKKIMNEIKEHIDYKEVDFEEAIKNNPSMINSPNIKNKKDELFNDLERLDFNSLIKKYIDR